MCCVFETHINKACKQLIVQLEPNSAVRFPLMWHGCIYTAAEAPLSWSSRVQIALDAARGLEYLHEHTRPSYIHRDIKSANILLDKDARAKVADFGLTKLTETKIDGNLATISTRVVGTWGYLSPE
ncbi:hypothetical protein KC19_5G043200 [Ceratodon purpureus]|uniref:non-specific serine/threonine protein kinase n=1 Tax=Ceratodon purpureus TaxID=3225 RepID=A0A8T0HZW5_CERPU|nr:hypothetical protein KC19_5G043200 [Ceratodon purpureus]